MANVGVNCHGRPLVSQLDLTLTRGRVAAIVGANGVGKTSLLDTLYASLTRQTLPEHLELTGKVIGDKGLRVGYVRQGLTGSAGRLTVEAWVDACGSEAAGLHSRHIALLEEMATGNEAALAEHAEVVERLCDLDAWDYPTRREAAVAALVGEGIDLTRRVDTLSGGEATRVSLAGMMLTAPTLLLLDEPTNNLDRSGIDALTSWLLESQPATLCVSHDRGFLDAVAHQIIAVEGDGRVTTYSGNYSAYRAQRELEFQAHVRQWEEQNRRRERLLAGATAANRRAQQFERISVDDFQRGKAKRVARQATVRRRRAERELTRIPELPRPERPRIVVTPLPESRDTLVTLGGATVATAESELLAGVDLSVRCGERLAVVGPNGSGKTTLLRVIAGTVALTGGVRTTTTATRIALLPQHPPDAPPHQTVVDYARDLAAISADEALTLLGRVLLEDVRGRRLRSLSIGERRRVQLAVLFATAPTLVLLDEPTNHLDLPTLEMLDDAVAAHTGGLIVASHDHYFIRRLRPHRTVEIHGGRLILQVDHDDSSVSTARQRRRGA